MVDGNSTTFEWQQHTGKICVLPVGSFEQHSTHLPLATDNLTAEYFAQRLAADFDAALLSTLAFGTCTEHSGFRGSISLRPETLMQVIRDIADEVERQGFRILIILNGHGGNFALGPVVRDINRLDRPLKILLALTLEFAPPSQGTSPAALDFHAGEMETSVMLALRPDLVRSETIDRAPPANEEHPLRQTDLNTFGMGHFNPAGAVGHPSLASAEKGQAVIEETYSGLVRHLQNRISRLENQWRYSGAGGVTLRPLTLGDIEAGMRLKTLAGWNQVEDDWRVFLENNPGGCFGAVHQGMVVGTAASIRHGGLAWIGLVLVDPAFRRMGIGTRLLKEVLRSLEDCDRVGLDATPQGQPLYESLGFVEEYRLSRMIHPHLPTLYNADNSSVPITPELWESLLQFDQDVCGANRAVVLHDIYRREPSAGRCLVQENQVRGFCLGRQGSNFWHLGPLMAETPDEATILFRSVLEHKAGQPVMIDVPDSQEKFQQWLFKLGFALQRPLIRMTRGAHRLAGKPSQQFAILGPEFG